MKTSSTPAIWKRHVALTQEHGSWVFLFSPLLIGLFAGGWGAGSGYLVLAALSAFLFKQPLTVAVKVLSKRRSRDDLPAAFFWMGMFGTLALAGVFGLWWARLGYLVGLAVPALPVLVWYLYLVSHRAERRQIGVEIVGSGVLALAATGAYWVGVGSTDPLGWWLWLLTWFQSAASIVYAALRLEQRPWPNLPSVRERLAAGARSIAYTTLNLVLAGILGIVSLVSPWLWVAYLIQWAESVNGTLSPAMGVKPTRIGFRQLFVSTLFTVVFILLW